MIINVKGDKIRYCIRCVDTCTLCYPLDVQRKEEVNMDQSKKADLGKPRLTLVPTEITRCIARVREFAFNKYGEQGIKQWQDVETERWRDAAYRHFLAYIDDPESVDEESGLPHLWHLACNVAFLCSKEGA